MDPFAVQSLNILRALCIPREAKASAKGSANMSLAKLRLWRKTINTEQYCY